VDDVYWKAAVACFVLFSSFVRPSKERGRAVFVRSPSSIEYRYSLFPSSLSAFLPFFFREKKLCQTCVLFYRALPHYICPHFPSSRRLSIRSLLPQTNLPRARTPLWISYRIVLYYNTYLFSSKRLTNLFIQTVTVRYMYSGNQDVAKYRAYGTVY
jgi:hypothetical protein